MQKPAEVYTVDGMVHARDVVRDGPWLIVMPMDERPAEYYPMTRIKYVRTLPRDESQREQEPRRVGVPE